MGIPPGLKKSLASGMLLADETQAQESFSGKGAVSKGQTKYGEGGDQYHGRPEHEARFADRAGVSRAIIGSEPVEGEGHQEEDGSAEKVGNQTFKHRIDFFMCPMFTYPAHYVKASSIGCGVVLANRTMILWVK